MPASPACRRGGMAHHQSGGEQQTGIDRGGFCQQVEHEGGGRTTESHARNM